MVRPRLLNTNDRSEVTDSEFGAVGDGVTDDSGALQDAIDYLQSTVGVPSGATGNGVYAQATLVLTKRRYLIGTCLEMPSYIGIRGDRQTTLIGGSSSTDILRIGAAYNRIEGILFRGGRRAIVIGGPSAHYGGNIGGLSATQFGAKIQDCVFRYQNGPSIAIDASTEHRGASQNFEIQDCEFEGCCFWYGTSDGANFTRCRCYYDTDTVPVEFTAGGMMGLFVSGGVLNLSELTCTPANIADTGAWIVGTGIIRSTRNRWGGEDQCPFVRVRTSSMAYLGEALPLDTNILAVIASDRDALTSDLNKNLIEIYDDFPAAIIIREPSPFGDGTARGYRPFASTDTRIWVDSASCPASEWRDSKRNSLTIDVPPNVRFYTSADATLGYGTDLGAEVARFRETTPVAVERVQQNLWPASGILGALEVDPSYGYGGTANGGTFGSDTTLGVTIRNYTSTTAADTANVVWTCGVDATTNWGRSEPAGLYTVSVLVKANFLGTLNFVRASGEGAMGRAVFVPGSWQRLACSFYHDGADKRLAFGVYSIPGTSGTAGVVAMAFPAVHAGPEVCVYQHPGNVAPPTPAPITYYGTTSTGPASGTYRVGDRYVVTSPTSGATSVLVCTVAGSPGTWRHEGGLDASGMLAPGSRTFGADQWHIQYQELALTGSQELTLESTAEQIVTDL